MYANPARTEEIFIVNTFTDFDKEVFFAVRATDGANEAEESNIVSVFIASITTTTSKGSFLRICYSHYTVIQNPRSRSLIQKW